MSLIRRAIIALALLAGIVPAMAQVPPPVPALPDTERRTTYSISGTTCICAVNFALYGDSTDYANWLEVFVNGLLMPQSGNWTITSPTGSLATIPRPITDAVLTFTAAQTGTVQIVGARRPRRASQFSENAGVPARAFNQVLTDIIAQNREIWDKTNDFTGRAILGLPGETLAPLPAAASRASQNAIFDSFGNLTAGTPITGGGVISAAMQPVTSAATLALGRTAFGLGTAATQNTGTSGATLPFLNGTNIWSGPQTFNSSDFLLAGSGSGTLNIKCAAACGSNTLTFPAGTTDFSATGGANQFVKQTSAGGALTVAAIAGSDLPLTSATLQASPGNPSNTTSTTGVMMGLGTSCHITPVYSTRILLHIQGQVTNTTTGISATVTLRFGTGTAPVNGAALTGNVLTPGIVAGANPANYSLPFNVGGLFTGFGVGVAAWFDVSLAAGANTAAISNVSCYAIEF